MTDMPDPIDRWHAYMHAPSEAGLSAMLAEDSVFISPVVHTAEGQAAGDEIPAGGGRGAGQ
jgi:hypothetical protein